ncbi:hypothetical protein GGI12_001987 [Dipsacomyces acuminosporus]|nr:hypothetical protein GGI12_001987 [Dipsacomyces acuminosporus]
MISATTILMLSLGSLTSALSHSNMHQPPDAGIHNGIPSFESEDHIIFGAQTTIASVGSNGKSEDVWNVNTGSSASWHVWSYKTISDRIDLPLWPATMREARIILSTDMCRDGSASSLPPAPFMPARGLEHCGIHISATSTQNAPSVYAYANMRRWISSFMGWSAKDADDSDHHSLALGPESFIDIGSSSIYYFHPFDSQSLSQQRGRGGKLDLVKFAIDPNHHLRSLITPAVSKRGRSWLDQHRIEISLSRTPHGFVSIGVQMLSALQPSSDIFITPLANVTSHISWISAINSNSHRSFTLKKGQKQKDSLAIPDSFYTQRQQQQQQYPDEPSGELIERTRDFGSFHPSIEISTWVNRHRNDCHLDTIQALPRTYFFDPYQLYDVREQLGGSYEHYGPVELEKPAEVMKNWGSILRISSTTLDSLNATIPIHARYRLAPIHERTVGYNGEPDKDTHVETVLLPAISAVVCPQSGKAPVNGGLLQKLVIRPALFKELGISPVSVLSVAAETDVLLRMAVGNAQHIALIQYTTLAALFSGTVYIFLAIRQHSNKAA